MIREWMSRDTPEVARIEKESFSDPWSERMLTESLENPAFRGYVCEMEGCIAGYVGYIVCGDAEIALIAVDGRYRRKGIGRELLLHAIAKAKEEGCGNVFLEVRASNSPARAMYEGVGFVPISLRHKYYGDGEDAVVMVLPAKC